MNLPPELLLLLGAESRRTVRLSVTKERPAVASEFDDQPGRGSAAIGLYRDKPPDGDAA
jgi:hypothetical protein